MCLRDRERTLFLRKAIRETVAPGARVLDAGAGTGILSLFALEAGAEHVFAVEFDPLLCRSLEVTAAANGFRSRMTIIQGDARSVELPTDIDVVIAELIDTALIDEQQVPVLNRLWDIGVLRRGVAVVPAGYRTFVDFVHADNQYYGFHVLAPKHEWPFYASDDRWVHTNVTVLTETMELAVYDFTTGPVSTLVDRSLHLRRLPTLEALPINALRLSGEIVLHTQSTLGATSALNGPTIVPVEPSHTLAWRVRYQTGAGLNSLRAFRTHY